MNSTNANHEIHKKVTLFRDYHCDNEKPLDYV